MGNPELEKDSDGDGLTDLVEKRLGTNPNNPDTDGDDDRDDVDPWPTVPYRPNLTDAEKILCAAFAEFDQADRHTFLCKVIGPSDITPFEMPSRGGLRIWQRGETDDEPALGIPLIRIFSFNAKPLLPEEPKYLERPWQERVISWNSDRTEAKVQLGQDTD